MQFAEKYFKYHSLMSIYLANNPNQQLVQLVESSKSQIEKITQAIQQLRAQTLTKGQFCEKVSSILQPQQIVQTGQTLKPDSAQQVERKLLDQSEQMKNL